MPISGILQPEVLTVDTGLRLRKYEPRQDISFAWPWYQDPEIVYLVDGKREPYTQERLEQMYSYLDGHGELYFIEELRNDHYVPVGDVTFWPEDMPIVIGPDQCRGRGVGKKVVRTLVRRAKALGYKTIYVNEIYDYNAASRRCFQSVGFYPVEKTAHGSRYALDLEAVPALDAAIGGDASRKELKV